MRDSCVYTDPFHSWKGITDKADLVLLMEEGTIKEE